MHFAKKLALMLLGLVAIWVVAAVIGKASDSIEAQGWFAIIVGSLYLLGCVIYLAVDAALRHQQPKRD